MSLELLKSTLKYKHTLRSAVESLSPRLSNSKATQRDEDPAHKDDPNQPPVEHKNDSAMSVSVNMGNVTVL